MAYGAKRQQTQFVCCPMNDGSGTVGQVGSEHVIVYIDAPTNTCRLDQMHNSDVMQPTDDNSHALQGFI